MNIFFAIALGAFGIWGVIMVIYAYAPIIKRKNMNNKIQKNGLSDEIKKNLLILQTESNEKKLALAFVELMELSYVSVHTIVNKGNNYKDNVQCKVFCDFLTPEVIEKIKILEENNGECTF